MANMSEKTEQLRIIKEEIINLKESPLYQYRQKTGGFPVIGEGNHNAGIMFIGEAPGKNEAEQGRPFCGAAGRVLDELLISAGLRREEGYITNIVKDRPPANRDPEQEELKIYSPYLLRQINIIRPAIIITLGRFSGEYIMEKFGLAEYFTSIGKVHGNIFEANAGYGKIKIIPMYHPASALYNPDNKNKLTEDFKNIKEYLPN